MWYHHIIKELKYLLCAAAPYKLMVLEVTALVGSWGRLLLFHQVDQGKYRTDQQTRLNEEISDLVDRIPSYDHDIPLLSRRGQKKPPSFCPEGAKPQTRKATTTLYLVCYCTIQAEKVKSKQKAGTQPFHEKEPFLLLLFHFTSGTCKSSAFFSPHTIQH